MKIYVIEYDIEIKLQAHVIDTRLPYSLKEIKGTKSEHKIEYFNDRTIDKFIKRAKELHDNDGVYSKVENLKIYKGELEDFDINKVLHPFE